MSVAARAAEAGWNPERPTNYLDYAQPGLQNEKRALLALIAEKGTEGQAEWERQRQAALEARRASLEAAAARGSAVNAPAALQAELAQDYDRLMGGLRDAGVQAQMSHGREMDRIAAANAAYYDQMMAGVPHLKNLTDADIEKARLAFEVAKLEASGAGGGGGGRGGRGSGGGGGGGPTPFDSPGGFPGATDDDGSYQRNEDRRFAALKPPAQPAPLSARQRLLNKAMELTTGPTPFHTMQRLQAGKNSGSSSKTGASGRGAGRNRTPSSSTGAGSGAAGRGRGRGYN
jgi:hypothetical protein